jgi:hypothetical protein
VSDDFDPYYRWLAIPPEEQPPHYYRLLALRAFESDEEVIQNAADLRMLQLRSVQTGKHAALSQELLNEVAAARACLMNPRRRAEYDAQLKRQLGEQAIASPPPAHPPSNSTPAAVIDLAALPDLAAGDPFQAETVPVAKFDAAPYAMAGAYAPPAPRTDAGALWVLALVCGALAIGIALVAIPVVAVIALSGGETSAEQAESASTRPTISRKDDRPGRRVIGGSPADGQRPNPPRVINAPPPSPAKRPTPTPTLALGEGAPLKPPPANLLDDALLHYDFEPDSAQGESVVVDRSGHEFHGQIKGSPLPRHVGSPVGGAALWFEGRNGGVHVSGLTGALCNDLKELTVSAWIAPDLEKKTGMIFDVGWYGTESITLLVDEGEIKFTLSGHHIGTNLRAPLGGRAGWRHVAGVWDGKEQRLYLDGKVVARQATRSGTLNPRSVNRAHPVTVGASAKWYKAGQRHFRGQIDELIVLPRGLSDGEVGQLFDATRPGSTPAAKNRRRQQ